MRRRRSTRARPSGPAATAPLRTAAATAEEPRRFRARQREVRGERPCVARKSPARERARDRLRERDERLASRTAADPDDLRRAPRRKAPDALQLEVEARHARGRRARRATDVLHAVFGKLVEKTKCQVALGGGHPPELAFGKADVTRGERRVEHRIVNGDGEEGADLRLSPSLLPRLRRPRRRTTHPRRPCCRTRGFPSGSRSTGRSP